MCFGAGGPLCQAGWSAGSHPSPPEGQGLCLAGHNPPPRAPDAVQTQELGSGSSPCWNWPVPVLFLPAVLPSGCWCQGRGDGLTWWMPRAIPAPRGGGAEPPAPPSPWQQPPPITSSSRGTQGSLRAPLQMSQHCRALTLAGHPAPAPAPRVAPQRHPRDEPRDRKGLPHSEPLSSEP